MKERYCVTGMTCSACSSHVEKAVRALEGMQKVSVNLLTETMDVEYDLGVLSAEQIINAVVKAGYGAALMAEKQNGARQGRADGKADAKAQMQEQAKKETQAMQRRLGLSLCFLLPLMYLAMYPMYHRWLGIPAPGFLTKVFAGEENAMQYALTQFLLLLPILYVNRKFFIVGGRTLLHRSPNMDSLVALGALASTGYGIFAMYRISWGLGHDMPELVSRYLHDLYFESAGMILTLITVGKFLESRSKRKTSDAIIKLMDLTPKTAILVEPGGTEREVPVQELGVGDIFLVRPGSLIPVDGTVLWGASGVDESALTGESIPAEKEAGDTVMSAALNLTGTLRCRADRVGEDTTLAQMIRLVEEAGASKAPIARLADRVAGVFVPVVMGIALATFCGWMLSGAGFEFAISTAIAVLVISCPCALGLATPVAIMVGTGVGAGNGILFKSGEALQAAGSIDTVVLDKTGTVTEGKLAVSQISGYVREVPEEMLLMLAASLEKLSEHPLASAITAKAQEGGIALRQAETFRAVFGRGIQGCFATDIESSLFAGGQGKADGPTAQTGNRQQTAQASVPAGSGVYVGNRAFLEENGFCVSAEQAACEEEMAAEGMTPLWIGVEKLQIGERVLPLAVLGLCGVSDQIKKTSAQAVQMLRKMGICVVMLTGDNCRTGEAVRRRVGIDQVVAQVLPQEKERHIRALQEQGHKVAMVGDGINDAPALAAAQVGMAIGAGTDVAIESGEVVLMKNDLRDVATAICLSRAVIRNIKQNLFWAFFYNSVGIPLAAGLLYPAFGLRLSPMFGAAAMSMSSLFVVGNALRLRMFRTPFYGSAQKADPGAGTDAALAPVQENSGSQKTENNGQKAARKERNENMQAELKIEGMMCSHCTGRVQKALEALEGVTGVVMSLEDKTALVTLGGNLTDEQLREAVVKEGYEVTNLKRI